MMKELLHVDGPLVGFLDKTGQLILLNLLWLLGCLPVVTIGASNAAFYYAVVKSIRRGQGNPVKEFARSYRENLSRGIISTVAAEILGALLVLNLYILQGQDSPLRSGGSVIALALMGGIWVYIGPVFSRFRLKLSESWSLAFVMAFRFLPCTLLMMAGMVLLVYLQVFVLPIPTVVILPGIWCCLASFPMEKILRRYMPPKEENDNTWYYES